MAFKKIIQYALIYQYNIYPAQIARLKKEIVCTHTMIHFTKNQIAM